MNTHISFRFSLNLFYKLTLSSSVIPSLWLCKFSSLCCRQHWGFIGYIFCWVKLACHIAFRVRCCLFLCYLFPRYVQNAMESSINIYLKICFLNLVDSRNFLTELNGNEASGITHTILFSVVSGPRYYLVDITITDDVHNISSSTIQIANSCPSYYSS